jgi:outer membrane immunogenic protein
MKRVYFLLVSVLASAMCTAQIKLGAIGGPQFDKQKWVSNNNTFNQSSIGTIRLEIGVMADIPLAETWSIQPELLYSRSKTKQVTDFENALQSTTYNLGYLKMPVCIAYLIPYPKSHIYFGAGPYISTLVLNNYSYYQNDVNLGSGKMRIGKTANDQFTAWDYGARFKTGIQFKKGFMAGIFVDRGIKDINPQSVRTFNNTAGVNFAYLFGLSRSDKYNRYPDYYNY